MIPLLYQLSYTAPGKFLEAYDTVLGFFCQVKWRTLTTLHPFDKPKEALSRTKGLASEKTKSLASPDKEQGARLVTP